MSRKLNRTQHSVYCLTYHLVLATKYRRKVITQEIFDELMRIFKKIAINYNINMQEANWDCDHVHVLFEAAPNTLLVRFINSYKSASSRIIKRKFPEIKDDLWKSAFWKTGYFLTTTGGANIETIQKYIRRQRKK
jgi:putative transposase